MAINTSAEPPDTIDPDARATIARELIRDGVGRLQYLLRLYTWEVPDRETIHTTEKMRALEYQLRVHVEGFCWGTAWARRAIADVGSPETRDWCDRIHRAVSEMWEAVQRAFRPTLPENAPACDPARYSTVVGDTGDVARQAWEEAVRDAYHAASELVKKARIRLLAEIQTPPVDARHDGTPQSEGLANRLSQGS